MIRCAKCGHIDTYTGIQCPACKERLFLAEEEINEKIEEITKAASTKQYELVAEGHHILADFGRVESQREYATMLEKGDIVTRDLDAAMKYYYMAAEKNDAYSAFKYSRLAERTSDKAAMFWLTYSAILGCVESYPVLAAKLAESHDNEHANYYYALSAAYDDTDSIVTLAKRYYNGIGTEQNLPYAKWYMDKLMLPPIHAIKMAYKLRSVKAKDPGTPTHPDLDRMLRRMAIKAQDYGYKSAYHNICVMLSDRCDMQARMILGMLYAEGVGCERDINKALELLESSAVNGNPEAYKHMGDIYIAGRLIEQNPKRALECYKSAAKYGMTNAYEAMGDIYCEGELVKRDLAKAIELYDSGAEQGDENSRVKGERLKRKRYDLYEKAQFIETEAPEDAFRCYAVSANMGYIPAYKALGKCFLHGIGIKQNRAQAYLWYERAVESGDDDARYDYALCYSRGIGTQFNFNKATELLSELARKGHVDATLELRRLMNNKRRNMIQSVYSKAVRLIYMKKFEDAAELLELCVKFNHAKGIYTLGCLNEFGLGIPTDRENAFHLYEMSYDLKFRDPKAVYKLCILRMARAYK